VTRSPWFVGLLASLASGFIAAHARTLRIERVTRPGFAAADRKRVIFAFWHGRQFLLAACFREWNIAIVTAVSWAGEVQAGTLTRLGYVPVRASSRRRGFEAILAMKRAAEAGHPIAVAVDGPKGPPHVSKPGVLLLARQLGCPIVPVATAARRAWTLPGTWDRYLLPWPFTRCVVGVGEPLWAAADGSLTREDLDRAISALTEQIDAMAAGARAAGRRRR
jgi:lysophospholipid acyltransferase (LPLAT)-like uncharacterized protein